MIKIIIFFFILNSLFSCKTKTEIVVDRAAQFVKLIQENKINDAENLMQSDYSEIQQKSRSELIGEMLYLQNKIKNRKFDENKFIIENDESTVCFLFNELTLYVNLTKQNSEYVIESFFIM